MFNKLVKHLKKFLVKEQPITEQNLQFEGQKTLNKQSISSQKKLCDSLEPDEKSTFQQTKPTKPSKLLEPQELIRTRMQTGLDGVDFQMEYQEITQISCIQARIQEILKE